MSLSFREVQEILELIEGSAAEEVQVSVGDVSLHVRRRPHGGLSGSTVPAAVQPAPVLAESQPAAPSSAPAVPAAVAATPPIAAAASGQSHSASRKMDAVAEPEGCIAIKAPLVGVFYHAPAPDAPPFVEAGQQVAAHQELCIIEVMKVMNFVKAPAAGTIERVCATNAETVEYGAVLFWLRPHPSD